MRVQAASSRSRRAQRDSTAETPAVPFPVTWGITWEARRLEAGSGLQHGQHPDCREILETLRLKGDRAERPQH